MNICKSNISKHKIRSVKSVIKNTAFLSITAFTMLSLIGCSNQKQVDYTTEATEEVADAMIEVEIPDKVSYELIGEGGTIIVDADIILPENHDKCTVVEYSIKRFTDEDVQHLAEQIFDKDSYFLYMPYSEEQIELAKDKLTSIKDASADDRERYTLQNELLNLDNRLNNLSPAFNDIEQMEAVKLYTIPSEDEWHPEIEKCCLIGTIDGRYYYMLIAQGADKGNVIMKLQLLRDMNKFDANGNLGSDSLDVQIYENKCVYSKDEAKKLATDYIQSLGYTDYEVIEVFDCKENNYAPSQDIREMNSYNIYFGRKIDGYKLAFNTSNYPDFFIDTVGDSHIAGNNTATEYIKVNVDSEGVSELTVFNPMKEERILDNHAKLQSFENIDNIAREDLQEYINLTFEGMQIKTININEIELGYGYTYDQETDRYALIPAWFYMVDENRSNFDFGRTDFTNYNAMDGSPKDINAFSVTIY